MNKQRGFNTTDLSKKLVMLLEEASELATMLDVDMFEAVKEEEEKNRKRE